MRKINYNDLNLDEAVAWFLKQKEEMGIVQNENRESSNHAADKRRDGSNRFRKRDTKLTSKTL